MISFQEGQGRARQEMQPLMEPHRAAQTQTQTLPTREQLRHAQLRMTSTELDDVCSRAMLMEKQRRLNQYEPKNGQCVYCYKQKLLKGPSPRICKRYKK